VARDLDCGVWDYGFAPAVPQVSSGVPGGLLVLSAAEDYPELLEVEGKKPGDFGPIGGAQGR
jgi:hypothetical protein